jgi:hypothetical protein
VIRHQCERSAAFTPLPGEKLNQAGHFLRRTTQAVEAR